MTTLTKIPRNIEIQTLPYMGNGAKKQARYRQYAVHVNENGTMPKIGGSFTNLNTAMKKASDASVKFGKAAVFDQSKGTSEKIIALFRKGIQFGATS